MVLRWGRSSLMFLLPSGLGLGGPRQLSMDFEAVSNQYLTMSDANFGAFDRAKFAISLWFKRESTGGVGGGPDGLFAQYSVSGPGSTNSAFSLSFTNTSKLAWECASGVATTSNLITTAQYTDTTSWHHVLVYYDSANATSGDRMRMWYDGTEVTVFDSDSAPVAAVQNSTLDVNIGCQDSVAAYPGNYPYDGKLYQVAFFSGSLPAIGSVYNSGHPVNITGLPGLYALLYGNPTPGADDVLAADWTNVNTVVFSRDAPR